MTEDKILIATTDGDRIRAEMKTYDLSKLRYRLKALAIFCALLVFYVEGLMEPGPWKSGPEPRRFPITILMTPEEVSTFPMRWD